MSQKDTYDAAIKALKMLKRVRRLDGTMLIHEGILLSADTPFSEEEESGFVRETNSLISLYRNAGKPMRRTMLGFDGGNVLLMNCPPFIIALFFADSDRLETVEASVEDYIQKFAGALGIDAAYSKSVKVDEIAEVETPAKEEEPQAFFGRGRINRTASVITEEPEEEAPLPRVVSPEIVAAEVYQGPMPGDRSGDDSGTNGPGLVHYDANALTARELWQSFRTRIEGLLCKVLGASQAKRIVQRELKAMGIDENGYLALGQFRPFGRKLIGRVKDRATKKLLENEMLSIVNDFSE